MVARIRAQSVCLALSVGARGCTRKWKYSNTLLALRTKILSLMRLQ